MNINDAPISLADTDYIWKQVEAVKVDVQANMDTEEVDKKHAEFAEKFPTLFKMVKSGANLKMLKEMTETIEKIKKGKQTYKMGMKSVAEKIGKEYLPNAKLEGDDDEKN